MHIGRSLGVLGFAVSLAAPVLVAQSAIVSFGGVGPIGGVTGEPYTATRKTTHEQTLANGTRINRESITKEARDSAGRTYRENRPELPEGADGGDFAMVNIFDPVNRVSISWNTRSQQATINHFPDPEQIHPTPVAPKAEAASQPPARIDPLPTPQIERLGTQTINGVNAEGVRVTRVIPAGREGNDQPITITNETWRSKELRIVVRSIQDDPRNGVTTNELTDIQQGEPDPALFQVPEGYTVKEHFPQQPQN